MTHADPDYVGIQQAHGDVGNVVSGADHRVHTGPGSQFNDVGVVIISDQAGRERRRHAKPLKHSAEQRKYLQARFVEPQRFSEAQGHLKTSHTVFISGPPGSGRQSAAKMLLWRRFPNDDASFRTLTLDTDNDGLPLDLDPDSVQQHETLLLDLSTEDSKRFTQAAHRIETFRAAVERNNAALVIVLPTESEHLLGDQFTHPKFEIDPPSRKEVLRKHLVAGGVPIHEHKLGALGTHPTRDTMRGLERLAARIIRAKEKAPQAGFEQWATQAIETTADYKPTVADEVSQYTPVQRAMLLAAAMVEEAHADSAHAATTELLRTLEFPPDDRHILEREGIETALTKVKVTLTDSRLISFSSPLYSESVRDHFWANYPELREALCDWVGKCVSLPQLTEADTDRLVARFARQACRTGRVMDLWTLAEQWTRHETDERRTPAAARWAASALAYGLAEDASSSGASEMRRKIYEAATNTRLHLALGRVLVSVCADVMAEGHPDQALVRLRLLAAHRSSEVAEAARNAIRQLTDSNRFYRRFLWRMMTWLNQQRRSDIELFLALARADRLLAEDSRQIVLLNSPSVREQLSACWRNVLTFDESLWQTTVLTWFDAACHASNGQHLLDVLVIATDAQLSPLARLHVLARDWAHETNASETSSVRRKVLREIDIRLDRSQKQRLDN